MKTSVFNLASALALAGLSSAANTTEWKSQFIYQVMTDRFARPDLSTTAECDVSKFCGGTWAGLIKQLDYIQDMGFTAIQISPVSENMEGETSVGEPYHGYWTQNLYAINKRFGTEKELKELSDELHKRGMLLMVDVVVNHMAQKFDNVIPPKVDYSKFKPFNKPEYYHTYCNVTEWTVEKNYQECWLYPYGIALADLKTESPEVSNEMNEWVKELVSNYSIDGLRIDAAKHVNDEFLAPFVEASGVFAFGEVLTGYANDFCPYQNKKLLPGMPNYMDYFPLIAAFTGKGFQELEDIRNQAATSCTDVFALGAFSENHDLPRLPALSADFAIAKNAMTYILLTDGIPTVYQGQEQHFNGSETPHNREPLWQSGYDKNAPLYVLTSELIKLRKNAMKLSPEYLETYGETLVADQNYFCMKKGPSGSQIVFCITNGSSKQNPYEFPLEGFKPNDKVVDVISCMHQDADATGSIQANFGQGEPKVFVLQSALKDTGLCPETTPDVPRKTVNNAGNVLGSTSKMAFAAAAGWLAVFLF